MSWTGDCATKWVVSSEATGEPNDPQCLVPEIVNDWGSFPNLESWTDNDFAGDPSVDDVITVELTAADQQTLLDVDADAKYTVTNITDI